jgi:hypothetical protein
MTARRLMDGVFEFAQANLERDLLTHALPLFTIGKHPKDGH